MKMENETFIKIDLSYLRSVTGGDKEFEKQLLSSAVNDIDTKVDNLKKACQEQDAKNVRSSAHSLKSLTAIAGIPQIEHWSKQVDILFSDGEFNSKRTEPINDIINGWPSARTKLHELLSEY
jgi:HPt (histidine-containing phosphotransfer) domain-containing protein